MPRELLKSGDPINANWRKINEILIELERLRAVKQRHESAIAELRRKQFISTGGKGDSRWQ